MYHNPTKDGSIVSMGSGRAYIITIMGALWGDYPPTQYPAVKSFDEVSTSKLIGVTP